MYKGKGAKAITNLDGNEVWNKIYGYFCNFIILRVIINILLYNLV